MDNDMMTGYLAGKSDGGNNGGWCMPMGMGMGGYGMNNIWEWIPLLLIAGLFFGGNGFGWGGGGGAATQADVRAAVDQQTLISKLDQQTYGLADSTYALNNTITNGFHGVERSVCDLSHQISDCCCTTQRAIDGVNYNMAKGFCDLTNVMNQNTRDIIDGQREGTRAVLDFLVQEKLSAKDATISDLRMQISQANQNAYIAANQEAQTATLLRRLGADCPTPAYLVQPPTPINFPVNGCGTVQFGGNWGNPGCGNYAYTT
jgi:hypothetical protein